MENKTQVDKKARLNLIITIIQIIAIVVLLSISLVAMFTLGKNDNPTNGFMKFISFLQTETLWFFILIVLPLIALFLYNGYLLFKVLYVGKAKAAPPIDREALLEEAKRQLKEELMMEMQNKQAKEEKKPETNEENAE